MGGGPDMEDILAQMFGGMGFGGGMPGMSGMGGMGGMPGGMPGGRNVPRKGRSVEQEYEVTLEELYKGKTTKFSNTKNVVCQICKGTGGKPGAKSHDCSQCGGRGMYMSMLLVAGGILTVHRSKIRPATSRTRPCDTRDRPLWYLLRFWADYARKAAVQEV